MAIPIAVSGVATPENKVTHWRCVTRKQENRHQVPKSVLRAVLERMQFTLHATRRTPHGASRLVQAMSVWLVKSRRAPSRHSRDARVYGHTTTAMHKLSTPPPPLQNQRCTLTNASWLLDTRKDAMKKTMLTCLLVYQVCPVSIWKMRRFFASNLLVKARWDVFQLATVTVLRGKLLCGLTVEMSLLWSLEWWPLL